MNKEDFLQLDIREAIKFALKKLNNKEWTINQYNCAIKAHKKDNNNLIKQAEGIFNEND